jgi:glutamate-1-semialdehyde 2,1-aminomutase
MFRYKRSSDLFKKEVNYLPGGVSSGTRLWSNLCPGYDCALFCKKAKGAYIWDVDGNKYIDYRLGFGPVILGHAYKSVVNAVNKANRDGQIFAFNNEAELRLAEKISHIVKSAEMVRFTNSGTESTMTAIRIARAATKKDKILKFEGHYHGHHDHVLWSLARRLGNKKEMPAAASAGIPRVMKKLVLTEGWNDFEAVEKTLRKKGKEIAAVICEPIAANMGVIPPEEGFLHHLRELCDKHNVALIFDEVKTGFRVSLGGAQEIYKVVPDISTFAKSLGNGYPIGLVAGKREYMSFIGSGPGKVFHGGTYSSNPVSMAAANATIDVLIKKDVFEHMNSHGRKLMEGLQGIYRENKVHAVVQGPYTMFQSFFTERERIKNCREQRVCNIPFFSQMQKELMNKGVMLDEDFEEAMYMSYSHGQKEINKTLDSFREVVAATSKEGR